MTLDEMPRGEKVFVDANIFIYHFTGVSVMSTRFLKRCEAGDLRGITSWPVVFEVLHRLMLIEAVTRGLIAAGNVARRLRERPDVVRQLDAYHQLVQAIPAMGIEILPAEGESLNLSHGYRRKYGLLVNDSLTVALMERNRIRCLASVDEDFRPVAEIAVFSPSDLAPVPRQTASGISSMPPEQPGRNPVGS